LQLQLRFREKILKAGKQKDKDKGLEYKMKKTLLLMDVDGTIAESSQKISLSVNLAIREVLLKNPNNYKLGIVGGSKYEKIMEQLNDVPMTHIFSENGCVYHKDGILVSKKNIREHPLYPQMNHLIKLALRFISNVDYLLSGCFIDLRNGIIYISLIGSQATLDERKYFIDLDKKNGYRKELLELLVSETAKLGIADKLDVLLGGSVGIGIHPHEWDKVQVMDIIDKSQFREIHYFGDKYDADGNDHRLLNHPDIIPHRIDSVEQTAAIIKSLS